MTLFPHNGDWNHCGEPKYAQTYAGEDKRTDAKGVARFSNYGPPVEPHAVSNCPDGAPCVAPPQEIPFRAYSIHARSYFPVYRELETFPQTIELVSLKASVKTKGAAIEKAAQFLRARKETISYDRKRAPEEAVCMASGGWIVQFFPDAQHSEPLFVDPFTGKVTPLAARPKTP